MRNKYNNYEYCKRHPGLLTNVYTFIHMREV